MPEIEKRNSGHAITLPVNSSQKVNIARMSLPRMTWFHTCTNVMSPTKDSISLKLADRSSCSCPIINLPPPAYERELSVREWRVRRQIYYTLGSTNHTGEK